MFPGLTNADSLDFAQLGRNLSEGRGFTTYVLRPLSLQPNSNPLMQPDTTHGPLYPFVLALAFGVLGAKDGVVTLVSGIFYLLSIPIIYLLGCRLANYKVGILSAIVFTLNALSLEYAVSGLHITLYIFLTSAIFLILHGIATPKGSEESNWATEKPHLSLLLIAILTGLLYLTDPLFFWIQPVLLLMLILLRPVAPLKFVIWFVLPLALLTLPWYLRNYLVTGNAVFGARGAELWMNTRLYPGNVAYRMLPEEFIPGIQVLNSVIRKMFLGAAQILQTFPQITASWLLAFFLPSLFFAFPNRATNITRNTLLICFMALFFGMLIFGIHLPLFASIVPMMLIFGTAYMVHLYEESKTARNYTPLLLIVFGLLLLGPLLSDILLADKTGVVKSAPTARWLGQNSDKKDVVLSDQPWVVAWYANRPAIWLPATDLRVGALRKRHPNLKWLFLTDQTRSYGLTWQYIYDVLQRWSMGAAQARLKNISPPTSITISGTGQPLLEALAGFTAVPPIQDMPTGVIAVLDDKKPIPKRLEPIQNPNLNPPNIEE